MNDNPLVSVCMITYNQEAYIAQAIEGVLLQETDFPIEFVIGEDCSTDRTLEICERYRKKYPDLIKVFPRPKNVGMQTNFRDTILQCKGKYVAFCEGDDYWTEAKKLQIQIEFLEANPDFVICHHKLRISDGGNLTNDFIPSSNVKEISGFEDLAQKHQVHMASCVFRRGALGKFPDWFTQILCTDYALFLLISQTGRVKFIDKVMGVYRVHSGGVWSGKKSREAILSSLETLKLCQVHFAPRAFPEFSTHEASIHADLCFDEFENGCLTEFRRYYRSFIINYLGAANIRTILALSSRFLVSLFPPSIQIYKRDNDRN